MPESEGDLDFLSAEVVHGGARKDQSDPAGAKEQISDSAGTQMLTGAGTAKALRSNGLKANQVEDANVMASLLKNAQVAAHPLMFPVAFGEAWDG